MKFEMLDSQPVVTDGLVAAEDVKVVADKDGSTLVLPRNALEYVEATTRNRMRPGRFRSLFAIDNDVPEWADSVVYGVNDGYAQFSHGKEDLSRMHGAEVDHKEVTYRVRDFWSSYQYTRQELLKAARLPEWNLPVDRAVQVFMAAEKKLENIAMGVDAEATQLQMLGLTTLTGLTPAIAVTKTTSGTAWADDTPVQEMLADLVLLEQACVNGSKQTSEPDTIILPLEQTQRMQRVRNPQTDSTFFELAPRQLNSVRRIVGVHQLNGTGTAYCYNSADQEVLKMVIGVETREMAVQSHPYGFGGSRTPVMFSTGGLISKFPTAIAKMENI